MLDISFWAVPPARAGVSRLAVPFAGAAPSRRAVTAVMHTTPEMSVPAFVMNCLAPSIAHSPSSRRARVRVLPASLPASGSVKPNAPSFVARAQLRQPLALLLLRAKQIDRLCAQRRMRAQRDRHRGVHPGQLLHREHIGKRVPAAAAVLLGERNPHQAQRAELGDDLIWKRLRAIELLGHRRHLALGELAHRAADQLVVG